MANSNWYCPDCKQYVEIEYTDIVDPIKENNRNKYFNFIAWPIIIVCIIICIVLPIVIDGFPYWISIVISVVGIGIGIVGSYLTEKTDGKGYCCKICGTCLGKKGQNFSSSQNHNVDYDNDLDEYDYSLVSKTSPNYSMIKQIKDVYATMGISTNITLKNINDEIKEYGYYVILNSNDYEELEDIKNSFDFNTEIIDAE